MNDLFGINKGLGEWAKGSKKVTQVSHPSGLKGLQTTRSGGKLFKEKATLKMAGKKQTRGGGLTDEGKVGLAALSAAGTYGGLYANKKVKKMDDPFNLSKAYDSRAHQRAKNRGADKAGPQFAGAALGAGAGVGASRLQQGLKAGRQTTRGLNSLQSGGRAGNLMAGVRNTAGVASKTRGKPFTGLVGASAGLIAGSAAGAKIEGNRYLKANPKPGQLRKSDPFGIDKWAGEKEKSEPSAGRLVSAAIFPGVHGAVAGKKGKKLKAAGNEVVGGALLPGVGAAVGAHRAHKLGYYKKTATGQTKVKKMDDPFGINKASDDSRIKRAAKYTVTPATHTMHGGKSVPTKAKVEYGATQAGALGAGLAGVHGLANGRHGKTAAGFGGLIGLSHVAATRGEKAGLLKPRPGKTKVKKNATGHDAFGIS